MSSPAENDIKALYRQLLEAWNGQDARAMADLFAVEGESIGYDGSISAGPEEIYAHLAPIFANHPTARYVAKVLRVNLLGEGTALLRASAGMVPRGQAELNPAVNAHHTVLAVQTGGSWRIQLFQNTPAQFHGRPDLAERMTQELRELLK
ncbi:MULTISPECIES: SgcJ/EcaC family oxidoreductase [Paenibacillus]|uniref:SgcJ/EcaC family oxidoreductase n=1 Tax=Paenibacillus TaxID=44249 RepID=UPI0022B86AA3|nr:SgcJ/EcaC family oxidoreductase [Paenibacillus caseinilyticus]MCZ8518083.1 SgcJ/EcaC family oxidoreductase [Paenibacillus caseinilyticus]